MNDHGPGVYELGIFTDEKNGEAISLPFGHKLVWIYR